jgi:hypothetical protein
MTVPPSAHVPDVAAKVTSSPGGGAGRLLRALIRRGLHEEHVVAAALLVLELDAKAGR